MPFSNYPPGNEYTRYEVKVRTLIDLITELAGVPLLIFSVMAMFLKNFETEYTQLHVYKSLSQLDKES